MITFIQLFAEALLGLNRKSKILIALILDAGCIALAFALSMSTWLPSVGGVVVQNVSPVAFAYGLAVILLAWRLGLYRAVLRFAGVRVLWVTVTSHGIATLFLVGYQAAIGQSAGLGQYVALMALGVVLSGGGRILAREAIYLSTRAQKSGVIIYGAGESGRQLLTAIVQSHNMRAVAMIDDATALQGSEFHGVRVYAPAQLPVLSNQRAVETVILAMPSLTRARRAEILRTLDSLPVTVRTMPRISDILAGRRQLLDLQDVHIEDILGRDPVSPLREVMLQAVRGRVACVTGGGGSIGSELVRQLIKLQPQRLVIVELSEFALYEVMTSIEGAIRETAVEVIPVLQSVTDRGAMAALFTEHQVDLLFHAAAYKHVPLVEINPFIGVANNVFGTQATLDAAKDAGVGNVVLISTDKAVRPTNIMGATKRIAELIAQAHSQPQAEGQRNTTISMVRFGNVLSSSGSVIPRFQEQIRAGGPVTVTHPEITRYFMTIPEAVELVIQTAGMARAGDVFLLDMGEPVRILDLAIRMIRLSGFQARVQEGSVLGSGQSESQSSLVSGKSIDGEVAGKSNEKTANTGKNISAIPIVFTGLRPGEKLYEELLIDAAAHATEHPMIRRASESMLPWPKLGPLLAQLREACEQRDRDQLVSVLHALDIGYTATPGDSRPIPTTMSAPPLNTTAAALSAKSLSARMRALPEVQLKGPIVAGNSDNQVIFPELRETSPKSKANSRSINPILSKALHAFFLATRPLTLGVRAIIVNQEHEVLLVWHRYEPGWHLPGGGVEIGESALEALRREVREETRVEILATPQLVGFFYNKEVSKRDHVLVYRCAEFKILGDSNLSSEIAACKFFPLQALPTGTTSHTRRRIAECYIVDPEFKTAV